jgi:ATP phosphoribosyltransferase
VLTLAVPKGRLLEPLVEYLDRRGVAVSAAIAGAGRNLVVENDGLRVLLLKDADVPVYVAQGVAECGVAGLDQVLERGDDVLRLLRLPFGRCRLCLITREGETLREEGSPLLVASKYPRLTRELARRRGRTAEVIPLAGSVELAARLGLADAVVDLVETGRTLRENGLHPVEEWLSVAPYLIANRAAFHFRGEDIRALRRALGGGA